jgi:hypothetical protein
MIDSLGFWENLVENIERSDVRPWDIGRRLAEAAATQSHKDIAFRISKSPGYVDRHVRIGTGLHPDVIEHIEKSRLDVPLAELVKLAFIVDRYGDPDGAEQLRVLGARRRNRRPIRRDKDSLHAFAARITYMRTNMRVPPLIRPVVGAVLEYLENGGRPNFRELTHRIVGDRKRLYGEGPDDDFDDPGGDDGDDGRDDLDEDDFDDQGGGATGVRSAG